MAQILRYWECRVNPTGSLTWIWNGIYSYANFGATTYWWPNMNDSIGDEHNAQLIYHAGVSCQTKYKSDKSSSLPGRARDGFVNYWGMDNGADVKWRIWHLRNWKDMLVSELHAGRPILYSAGGIDCEIGDLKCSFPGHSWVIDGITVDHRKFWCNWGWYGNHNGWYELGDFNPDGDNYNQMESAIFNVYPVQSSGVATPQLTNQSFPYNSNGYILTVPETFGATSYEWITNKGSISGSGTSVTLYTDESATVQVRAYNDVCQIYSPYKSATITVNYGPVSCPDIVCNQGSTVSISNVPNGTITWGGTNVSYPNGNTGTSVTVRAASPSTSANGTVTANFTINGNLYTISHAVRVNPPYPGNLSLSLYDTGGTPVPYMCPNTHYHIYLNNNDGCSLSDYTWSIPAGWTQNYTWNHMVSVYTGSTPGGMVEVYANTCCGVNAKVLIDYLPGGYDCGRSYSLLFSPNPASGETTLSIEPTSEDTDFDENAEWDLEVYTQGQLLKEKKTSLKGKNTKIQTRGWTEGVYIVRVKYKDEVLDGKLVVKK